MKRAFFVILMLCIGFFLLLTCSQRSELFTKPDSAVRCYAFTCDTAITAVSQIGDTVHFATIDTIHTQDSVTLVGIIYPLSDKISKSNWTLSDGTKSDKDIYRKKFAKGGVYTCVFTIEDNAGLTMSDTVRVCVNTAPVVGNLISPANGAKTVDPLDQRGIRFQWTASDTDGDSLKVGLYISSDTFFLQPSADNIKTSFFDYIGNLKVLTKYFWRIVVEDTYGETDTSGIYSFTTKDPSTSGGQLRGYALYQGWKNHAGIKISVSAPEALQRSAVTNDSGFYQITNIDPRPNYTIIAIDTIKGEFVSDTTHDTITAGALTYTDTLRLKDPFKPVITDNLPITTQTIRQPGISAKFSDRGSGILVSSVFILFNDSNVTAVSTISDSGFKWVPARHLPDGVNNIAVFIKDSAGNISDTMKWTFAVDAMKLTILTQDTTVRINDTLRLRSLVSNVYSKIVVYKWDFDGNGTWDDSLATADTLVARSHVYSHEADYNAIVYARDDSGMVKLDTVILTVGNTAPVIASLRADTTISIKDSIQFFAAAVDNDGTIKEYAWDFEGDGTFEYTSATEIKMGFRYNTAGTYKTVLKVTDDDGKARKDTVVITVLQDVPVPDGGNDTVVSINANNPFKGTAAQQFGTIVMWKWDFDGDGICDDSSTTTGAASHTYTHEAVYDAKLLVRDDDGNEATAVRYVTVQNSAPVISSIRADTTISIQDTIQFIGVAHDPDGTIKEYAWDFEGDGTFDYTSATQIQTGYRYNTAGIYKVVLRVTDDDDKVTKDTAVVTVLQDVPVADAGQDTTVAINSSIPFRGTATQQFGTIVMWKWDFDGNGTYDDSSTTPPVMTYTYTHEAVYYAKLLVRDDDGNEATGVRILTVGNAAPVISSVRIDTIVSIKDSIQIFGVAHDPDGTIKEYAWDFEGDGTFEYTNTTQITAGYRYNSAGVYNAVLRVTDDDGKMSKDTTVITVLQDVPVPNAGNDTIVSIKDTVRLHGSATQQFGTITEWAWDIGNTGTFKVTSSGDTAIIAPSAENLSYPCVLRVTDDDGNVAKDTMKVETRQDMPVISFLSQDTILEHGGSIRCSVNVSQQFGTMTVEIDTANSGVFKGFGSLGLAGGKSYSIPTGSASSWDSVKIRITDDDGNVVTRGFKVDIRPQPLTITSIDSTFNTITVNYSQTAETDFAEYRIYRNTMNAVDTNADLWGAVTSAETVSRTTATPSYAWEPRYYRIYQKDNEGLWSIGSNVVYGNIRNTPPTIPVIKVPTADGDTIWADSVLIWPKSTDPNGGKVKYKFKIDYYSNGYPLSGTESTDTTIRLSGDDSLAFKFKVMAYDSIIGDSSAWSAERTAYLRPLVKDADGNKYHYVTIGTQVWLVENLKTTKYNDGSTITLVTDGASWSALASPGYCWYNDAVTYKNPYGALYNWYTVNSGKLAPSGWHVPTDSEWTVLTTYLGGESMAGGKLKETGTTHWTSPNTGATNETGFSALPGGFRQSDGDFGNFGHDGDYWNTIASNIVSAYFRSLFYDNSGVFRYNYLKSYGFSVKCLKGDPVPPTPSISIANSGDGTAVIAWNSVYNATSYNIYYATGTTVDKSTGTKITGATSIQTISGLTNGTQYAFVISAVNAVGESGLSPVKTTTPIASVTDIDGNVYHPVIIGTQVWMVENLKTTRYNDGTAIPLVTEGGAGGAWDSAGIKGNAAYCWYNNEEATYKSTYGALYNWYTVNTGKLAPEGWHIPTDTEWTALSTLLGGGSVAGGKLKEIGTTHWPTPNTGATNEVGFTALPGGCRESTGGCNFAQIVTRGIWGCATPGTNRILYYITSSLDSPAGNYSDKNCGVSVRLLRD